MNFLRDHEKAFKIITTIALIALILSSFLPFFIYLFQ